MKKILIYSLLLPLLFSCKKDKVPAPIDGGGLFSPEGKYYCVSTYEQQYTSQSSDVLYDMVIQVEIMNDSIVFNGDLSFPLSAYDMTTGSGSHTIQFTSGYWATLEFADGFDQIDFYKHYNAGSGSPTYITTYSGNKTNLELTSGNLQHYFNQMEGMYQLGVKEREDFNALDTSYSGQYTVDYLPSVSFPGLAVNGINRTFNYFHSYYTSQSQISNSGNYASYDRNFYWSNDSLYYDYMQRNWDFSFTFVDTIHYQYIGTKL